MPKRVKIAVIGAGAIGGVVGGYLTQAGEEVVVVGKKEQVRALKENGLTIEGVRGKVQVAVRAVEGFEEEVDLIVLAVKTQDVASSLEQHAFHGLACPVVTTQNGVRADTLLAERIDPQRIVSSIVMFGSTYLTPGKIIHNFEGDLIMGNYLKGGEGPVEGIVNIVEKVFPVIVTEDIMGMKWLKLFVNLNNCVPALIGKSMQECFADIHLCTVSIALLKEGLQLTEQAGINLHSLPTYPVERLHVLTSLPLEESARLFSKIMTTLSKEPLYGSILQSIRRGRPSEIDYLNGELVALAKERGCSAPLNEKVVGMVHQVEESKKFFSPQEVMQELSMTIE